MLLKTLIPPENISRPVVFCYMKWVEMQRHFTIRKNVFWNNLKSFQWNGFIRNSLPKVFCKKEILKAGLYNEIFLSQPWNFYFKRSVEIFQEAKCVSWNIIQFVHTIKFHSYDHNNVSFIERINNFHFSCHRYCSFKSCLKILKIFKDFPKIFSECAMFIRDRRSTNLTKNIVTAAPVSMNSTLDNAEVLDPLLKFIFKNWDVTQFIILLIIKKLPPITIPFHNFLVFLL